MPRISRLLSVTSFAALIAMSFVQQGCASMTRSSEGDAEALAAVRAVLERQVAAWNRGDIVGFMEGYARSDDTVFVSGDHVTRGWQTVLERYQKSYDSREKMGMLAFTDLEIKILSNDAAVALGRWQLTRGNDSPHGRFTLIFRRMPQGWRIVHDHTSSASQ